LDSKEVEKNNQKKKKKRTEEPRRSKRIKKFLGGVTGIGRV